METTPLHAKLLEEARRFDPAEQTRGLLAPYRDVLLLWRAKYMSYEQIAATLTSHGLKVSPAGVGLFCRRQFTKAEILRERQRVEVEARRKPGTQVPLPLSSAPVPVVANGTKRGPKIARDDY